MAKIFKKDQYRGYEVILKKLESLEKTQNLTHQTLTKFLNETINKLKPTPKVLETTVEATKKQVISIIDKLQDISFLTDKDKQIFKMSRKIIDILEVNKNGLMFSSIKPLLKAEYDSKAYQQVKDIDRKIRSATEFLQEFDTIKVKKRRFSLIK